MKQIHEILSEETLNELKENGYTVVPIQPSRGVLVSMALRENHAFLMPSQEMDLADGAHIIQGLDDRQRESTLTTMSQIYEEVVGQGFYHPDREEWYTGSLEAVRKLEKK